MKKVLILGRKKYTNELFKNYEVINERKIDKVIKKIFIEVPDIIIIDLTTTPFYLGFYLKNLIKNIDVISKIPFAAIPNKNLNKNFDMFPNILSESDIDKLIKNNSLTNADKKKISEYKLSNSALQNFSREIMDNLLIKSTILTEIKALYNFLNDDYALSSSIFNLINKYISYDLCGLYFNESKESSHNVLNLSLPNNNITIRQIDKLSNKFFDNFDKYKRINEVQTALVAGDISDNLKIKKFNTNIVIPYQYSENLTGGIYLLNKKELNIFEKIFFKVISDELNIVFKLKYMFNEQSKHALLDSLTGLYNKQEFEANLEKEFHRARRYIYNFTLAFIDIDRMGELNAKLGEDFGNYVIYQLSALLKEIFRRTDLIYRFGGDKIIVLMPMTPITKAIIPIERLKERISEYEFKKGEQKSNITVSVGLCANYSRFTEPEDLLNSLKVSLLRAKEAGRNKIDIYE